MELREKKEMALSVWGVGMTEAVSMNLWQKGQPLHLLGHLDVISHAQ